MNDEIIGKYLIKNGEAVQLENADSSAAGSGASIYEVIRVICGVPLFLEKHLERMRESARLLGYSTDALAGEIGQNIRRLIELNGFTENNVRLTVYNFEKNRPDYTVYFVAGSYPSEEDYRKGVPAILYHAERSNPNAKVVNTGFKEGVAAALDKAKAYEALLVNESGAITEGSRSNAFFVKGSRFYTAPGSMVLVGITRVFIYEACRRSGVEIIEEPAAAASLAEYDGIFLTGTSPKVLPVSSVDRRQFSSSANPYIRKVMQAYDGIINEYISSRK